MRKLIPIAWALAAGFAGLALNGVRPTVFTNIEWVLGGVFPLLAAAAFGRWTGLLAGAICFCLTPIYWYHYVGWLAYGLEAFAVGHLMQQRRQSLLGASLRYWLCFGIPVAAIYFTQFSYAAFPANYISLVKYPLNGLLVASIAQEISGRGPFRRWLQRVGGYTHLPNLRDLLIVRFSTLTALPILIISFVAYSALDRQISRAAEEDLQREVIQIRNALDAHLTGVIADWARLRMVWDEDNTPLSRRRLDLQGWMTQHPEWLDLQFADYPHTSTSDVGVPSVYNRLNPDGGGGQQLANVSFILRDTNRRALGRVIGSVDLVSLQSNVMRPFLSAHREIFIINRDQSPLLLPSGVTSDRRGQVITQTFLDALLPVNGSITHDRWNARNARMERFRGSFLDVPQTNWILVLEEPIWLTQIIAAKFFLATLGLTAAAVVLVNLLSRATAAEITEPLRELANQASALSHGNIPESSATKPRISAELEQIHDSVSSAAARLSETNRDLAIAIKQRNRSHDELQQVLGRLEQAVEARTADLQHALRAAEAADRTKGEFIGMMSHELRTPLNVMLGSLELMLSGQRGDITPDQTNSLRTIEENGHHLLSLIDDVLDFSRDQSGKLNLHREPIDPGEVCALAIRLITPHARRKQLKLTATYDHTVANLMADPKRMRQMVLNLLANAIKFTPVKGQINLRTSELADARILRISVSDTGIGIPSDKLEEIFVPFHQLDRSLSREFEGSGLGLTLVRRLADLHDGQVSVESIANEGSTFHLDFPLPAEVQPRLAVDPVPNVATSPSIPFPSPCELDSDAVIVSRTNSTGARDTEGPPPPRVLVVEDNVTNAELVRSYLSIMGCDSWIAANGEIGVRLADEIKPHLILMDVQMPVMDGIEATRRICANATPDSPAPPIVMVTALASASDRKRAFDAGAVDYLTKPFGMSDFSDVVARHLGSLLLSE